MANQYGLPRKDSSGDYLFKYGGHASILKDGKIVPVHPGTTGPYKVLHPEFAARLAAAGQAYEKETGKKPQYGELSRGEDVQGVYYNRYKSGQGGLAAAPGRSRHQQGEAGDLPDSEFRKWLYAGNKDRFGLHFPVKGDTPHVQMNPAFKGTLGDGAVGSGAAPGTAVPEVQAGAGPAAVAAARTADTAPSKASSTDPNVMKKAFLATLSRGEATGYDALQGKAKFSDFSRHPGTGVAGLYQFKPETWNEEAKKYGYSDFKPETQDTAAWNYARDSYTQKTGRRLEEDLASKDPAVLNNISTALSGKWTSLPGGAEPNSNWAGKDFASVYQSNLGSAGTTSEYPDPTPNVGAGTSSYSSPNSDLPASAPVDTRVSTADAADTVSGKPHNYGKDIGDVFSGFADILAKGPVAQNAARASSPANVPGSGTMPIPQGPVPMVDPRVADAQRQQLAMALQRLNSRKLV